MRVVLCHDDPDRALRFYVDRCGFSVEREAAPPRTERLPSDADRSSRAGPAPPPEAPSERTGSAGGRLLRRGAATLRILDAASLERTSPLGRRIGKSPGSGVALEVELAPGESLEDLFVKLEQSGADIVEPPGEWRAGERSFTVADPGRYLVTFFRSAQ